MVAEEVEALLDAADEGLVRVFFEERRESAYGYFLPFQRARLYDCFQAVYGSSCR